ncbi:MAG: site-2 protease family protein [Oscillospiraceae bacterium]|nr:site-2 protease family protein [Oscillospiraceae bacterium]
MDFFGSLNVFNLIDRFLVPAVAILVCLTIHELAHGLSAYALGDDTAKRMGRLTLNPIKHVDPVGFLVLMVVGFGWAKPVPVNPNNFKRPRFGMAITALAGPVSNFLLTALILIFIIPLERLLSSGGTGAVYTVAILLRIAMISTFLGLFNLLPVPPLDGSKVLFSFLPDRQYNFLMRYERYGMLALLALLWFGGMMEHLLTALRTVYGWIAQWTEPISIFLFG